MDPGPEQCLIDVNVAEADENRLVEECRLDGTDIHPLQAGVERLCRHSRIERFKCEQRQRRCHIQVVIRLQFHRAKLPDIIVMKRRSVREREDDVRMFDRIDHFVMWEEFPFHSEMRNEISVRQFEQNKFPTPLNILNRLVEQLLFPNLRAMRISMPCSSR